MNRKKCDGKGEVIKKPKDENHGEVRRWRGNTWWRKKSKSEKESMEWKSVKMAKKFAD